MCKLVWSYNWYNYSGTPLVRPPLLQQKDGLSREMASHQGINIYVMFRDTLFSGFSRGAGLSKGVLLFICC